MTPSTRTAGHHQYELTNHLGNVSVIVSDNKLLSANQSQKLYLPDVLEYQDYYPFGMVMNDRKGSYTTQDYRYGYNGKENDNDVKGESNQQDYGFRVYDPRVGRILRVDPLATKGPEFSPYVYTFNNPLRYIDPDGRWPDNPWYYLIEAYRQYFQAAGAVVDKITPTYQAKVYANVKVEAKTSYGYGSVTTTATTENSMTIQQGSFEQYFKTGKSPLELNFSSLEVSAEQKVTANINVRGVTVYAENKTSVGAKKNVGPVDCSTDCYYQRTGNSNQAGASVKAEATKTLVKIRAKNIKNRARNTEISISAKIGVKFSAFWDWIRNKIYLK